MKLFLKRPSETQELVQQQVRGTRDLKLYIYLFFRRVIILICVIVDTFIMRLLSTDPAAAAKVPFVHIGFRLIIN